MRVGAVEGFAGGRGFAECVEDRGGGRGQSPIPDGEVTGFRAEAYRSLASAEFARVDAVYTTGMAAACRWMHAMPDPGPITADEEPAEYLRSLLPIGLSANETKLGTAAGQRLFRS